VQKEPSFYLNEERGSVLLIALLMLALLSLIGIAGTTSSSTELRIAGNHKISTQAFYAAEAGIHHVIGLYHANPGYYFPGSVLNVNVVSTMTGEGKLDSSYSLGDLEYSISSIIYRSLSDVELESRGKVRGTNSSVVINARFRRNVPIAPEFLFGLLSDGNIVIHDASTLYGSMHANGSVSQTGSGTVSSHVSAVGSISVGSVVDGIITANAPYKNVPPVTSEYLNEMKTIAQTSGIYFSTDTTHEFLGEDMGGKVVFCDGNITIQGDVLNATIVSTGNATINGSCQINGSKIDTAVVAGGEIAMNGSGDSYGIFWCNGGLVQNSTGTVYGSMVSRGDITRNGSFDFTFSGNMDNDHLPRGAPEYKLLAWQQKF
jgi:hypothetical protein